MSIDRIGIVHEISRAISELQGNIADIRQSVLCGYFSMILLAAFPAPASHRPPPELTGQPWIEPLVEPLTERELAVLGGLVEGLSNPQIGQRLYISVGTVKAHTAAIFRKLDVANRTEAVARAKDLKLL